MVMVERKGVYMVLVGKFKGNRLLGGEILSLIIRIGTGGGHF